MEAIAMFSLIFLVHFYGTKMKTDVSPSIVAVERQMFILALLEGAWFALARITLLLSLKLR